MKTRNPGTLARAAVLGALPALALALVAGPAAAWRSQPVTTGWDRTAAGNLVDVSILVDGQRAPLYPAPGRWDRRYFEALAGRNYALRVHNRSGRRVGVLIAVDGLNVVNGERSALARFEPMYVLDPHETATIRGWRTSLQQVRRFVFVDEERSYATRTGQANGDMGWIRVLAFEEERPMTWFDVPQLRGDAGGQGGERPMQRDEIRRDVPAPLADGSPAPQAGATREIVTPDATVAPRAEMRKSAGTLQGAPQAESYPGTGWGDRRHDPVREVWFEPVAVASDHLVFRYEYAGGLRALGIFPGRDRLDDREDGRLGFARPPRW